MQYIGDRDLLGADIAAFSASYTGARLLRFCQRIDHHPRHPVALADLVFVVLRQQKRYIQVPRAIIHAITAAGTGYTHRIYQPVAQRDQ